MSPLFFGLGKFRREARIRMGGKGGEQFTYASGRYIISALIDIADAHLAVLVVPPESLLAKSTCVSSSGLQRNSRSPMDQPSLIASTLAGSATGGQLATGGIPVTPESFARRHGR